MSGETQIVIERHKIDGRTEYAFVCTGSSEIAPQIGHVVTLMPKDVAHPPRGFADELGYLHAWMHSEAHRHGVCQHPGRAPRKRRHPSGDRYVEYDVPCGGQTMHEDCSRR